MTFLVVGNAGLLGSEIYKRLVNKKLDVIGAEFPKHNITDKKSLLPLFRDNKIDYVINCAAYTDVPKAEIEKEKAYSINAAALDNLSELCIEYNSQLVHFSTDFVFDGKKSFPYIEEDPENPLSVYGTTKYLSEIIIKNKFKSNIGYTIFRLQWLFGHNPKTFFSKILERSKTGNIIKLVEDEWGSPCSVKFVSETILEFIEKQPQFTGELYHLTHDDFCSRFLCGHYFLYRLGFKNIEPISNLPMDVERPKYGVMSNLKLVNFLGHSLGSWKDDVEEYIEEMKNAK